MELLISAQDARATAVDLLAIAISPDDLPELKRLLAGRKTKGKGKASPSNGTTDPFEVAVQMGVALAKEERFEGKLGQSLFLGSTGSTNAKRIVLLGTGAPQKAGGRSKFEQARFVGSRAAKAAEQVSAKSLGLWLASLDLDREKDARAAVLVEAASIGLHLGGYKFSKYRSSAKDRAGCERAVLFAGGKSKALNAAAEQGRVIAAAIGRARDWVNEPPSEMTPTRLADEAKQIAKQHGLASKILDRAGCEKLGMGMYLAVGQGSDEEVRFVHLTYTPKSKRPKHRIAIIGKGVTFDSGGLSLKPSNSMETMKMDMAGAAAVISTMGAVAELGLPIEVHAIAACAENMPSGKAYKLGDVLKSMAGKTVEINNTDAEGRLTLGDAITYARKLDIEGIIDVATLTGACMVALGPHMAGVMSNREPFRNAVVDAARAAGEEVWPLPLPDRLKDQLKSDVADMRNTGDRLGGALTAGLFLSEFAGETPWVHIDLAGPAFADKEWGHIGKGGTGFGVATLVGYLRSLA